MFSSHFDVSTKNLVFTVNNVVVFRDTNFSNYIGKWILITFSNYIANSINYYYPNMMTLNVNRIDIAMSSTYSIPSSGMAISKVEIGKEIVALFAEFRFYSHFIQGAYGLIMSTATTQSQNLYFSIMLTGSTSTSCVTDPTITALGVTCVGDYHDYLSTTIQCANNLDYFDPTLTALTPTLRCL